MTTPILDDACSPMNQVDDKRVNELFTAGSRDLTPAALLGTAQVLYVPASVDPNVMKLCTSILSKPELQRAERFASEGDKARFIQRRAFRRYCAANSLAPSQSLSDIVFEETDNGQPYLADLPHASFSFSSCSSGIAAAWSLSHEIGVDMEDRIRDSEVVALARQYFSANEANAVEMSEGSERLQTFFQFWSLKESALKSIGEGLPSGLDAFEFELKPKLRVVQSPPGYGGPEQFNPHLVEQTLGCIALVLRSRETRLTWPTEQGGPGCT